MKSLKTCNWLSYARMPPNLLTPISIERSDQLFWVTLVCYRFPKQCISYIAHWATSQLATQIDDRFNRACEVLLQVVLWLQVWVNLGILVEKNICLYRDAVFLYASWWSSDLGMLVRGDVLIAISNSAMKSWCSCHWLNILAYLW